LLHVTSYYPTLAIKSYKLRLVITVIPQATVLSQQITNTYTYPIT